MISRRIEGDFGSTAAVNVSAVIFLGPPLSRAERGIHSTVGSLRQIAQRRAPKLPRLRVVVGQLRRSEGTEAKDKSRGWLRRGPARLNVEAASGDKAADGEACGSDQPGPPIQPG